MKKILLAGILTLITACDGTSNFSAGDRRISAPEKKAEASPSDTLDSGNDAGTSSSPAPAGGDVFDGSGSASLPTDCKDQNVLILDFKSGWWEGDGGDTFRNLILDEIKTRACPGSTAGVEYHHIIKPTAPAKFYDADFATYSQVWVLSGSLADVSDIALDHPGFVDLVAKIVEKKPRLFLGAGFGSVDHSNEVAKKIWGADLFKTDHKMAQILSVDSGGSNVTVKTHITPKVNGNVFEGVSGQLVDHVEVGGVYAGPDEIVTTLPGVKILADCTTSPFAASDDIFSTPQPVPSRNVACIGVAKANGFNVIADSGLQRFYGLYRNEEPTRVYLRNIFRALSL